MSEEVQHVIRRCKASSTPSPVNQVHYRVLKNCPSLMPALLRLFNTCWTTSSVPSQWKVGVHKALAVCWLDLANAYGSVQHDLIRYSLEHYHAPQQMVAAVSNLYQGLVGIVRTKEWSTEPFPMQIGVYQGDPLSVIIVNTVMNTLVDTISQSHQQLGYSLTKSIHRCNLLQYADDTSLLAHGPAACQSLLECTERWLHWSRMKP